MAEARPDQVRDKDHIQRDTITAKIVGPVYVDVVPLGGQKNTRWPEPMEHFQDEPHWVLVEEPDSVVPKFAFLFNDLHAIKVFASQLTVRVESLERKERERKE